MTRKQGLVPPLFKKHTAVNELSRCISRSNVLFLSQRRRNPSQLQEWHEPLELHKKNQVTWNVVLPNLIRHSVYGYAFKDTLSYKISAGDDWHQHYWPALGVLGFVCLLLGWFLMLENEKEKRNKNKKKNRYTNRWMNG